MKGASAPLRQAIVTSVISVGKPVPEDRSRRCPFGFSRTQSEMLSAALYRDLPSPKFGQRKEQGARLVHIYLVARPRWPRRSRAPTRSSGYGTSLADTGAAILSNAS
jgi:hypothetical protein